MKSILIAITILTLIPMMILDTINHIILVGFNGVKRRTKNEWENEMKDIKESKNLYEHLENILINVIWFLFSFFLIPISILRRITGF